MGNEINRFGKIVAGLLLVILTTACIVAIIGYWPNKLPAPGSHLATYSNRIFHVRLLDSDEVPQMNTISVKHTTEKTKDSVLVAGVTDSARRAFLKDSAAKADSSEAAETGQKKFRNGGNRHGNRTIDINTLLLLLVAVGGFLGNMIHVATSFTTYVGAERFKKSWILWYCVKPFSASALAVTLYFAFRAGFLNYSSDASNINLFGVMTLAIMSGLFTDIATQKLKEIFEVTFRPKEVRPDPLVPGTFNVLSIIPDKLDKAVENTILIKGTGLDQTGLVFKINSEVVVVQSVKSDLVTIKYTVPASQQAAESFKLEIFNADGKVIKDKVFT